MNKRILVFVFLFVGLVALVFFRNAKKEKAEPITFTVNASLRELTIDDKIREAQIIVIGRVEKTFPSKWKYQNQKDVNNSTPGEIIEGGLFTDQIISIERVLKGDYQEPTARVRTFKGETDQFRFENSSEPTYVQGKLYLLFLDPDTGPTAIVDPGDYISVNANTAVYEIVDGKAISADDEWLLEDLISYIENSISGVLSQQTLPQNYQEIFPNTSGNPLGSGEEVTFEDAQSRISYPIPLPGAERIEQVWISLDPENPAHQSVAIRFEKDLTLIIHKIEGETSPDWDKTIEHEPLFKKIDVNGNFGIGHDPGVTEIHGQPYHYPGGVMWWVNGLDIALYSDTLSLEDLLAIAQTVSPDPVFATTDTLTEIPLSPTEISAETQVPAETATTAP